MSVALVLVEHEGGAIKDATLATVTAAAKLGEVHALVAGQGVGDEAVVGGIDGGREQPAVEPDHPGDLVDLVLVPAPLGDLDHDVDGG